MKFDWNKRHTTRAVYTFLVLAATILFYFAISNFSVFINYCKVVFSLLKPFFIGFAIAYLLNPIVKFFEEKWLYLLEKKKKRPKIKRAISIVLTFIIAASVLTLFFLIVIPQIASSLTSLINNIPLYIESLTQWGQNFISEQFPSSDIVNNQFNEIIISADEFLKNAANFIKDLMPVLYGLTIDITILVKDIILGIIISIYMIAAKETFCAQTKKVMYALMPNNYVNNVVKLTHTTNNTFGGFISGKLLDSLIIGIICFIGMSIFKMPYAVLISVIVGVTNVIPYFGPFFGAIPSALIILIIDPVKAIWFGVFILVLQQFDGNILGPKILGQTTGLSAFWVIFSILLGGGLFGFIGMFLAVPLFSVIYSLIRSFIEYKLEQKNLSKNTKDYIQ